MQQDMLLLAERLVVAMETISQDVKIMSAYIYNISSSVSYLLNENKEKEGISVVARDESDNPSSAKPAAGQEDSAEEKYSGLYEPADKTSSLHVGDPEHGESSFGDMAPTSIDPYDSLNVLSSENNSIFTKGIKLEELSEDDVSEESREIHNTYGNCENTERVWLEVKSEEQTVTGNQNESYGMQTTTSNPPEQSTDYTAHMMRMPEEQATSRQRKRAEDVSMVRVRVDPEERPFKCSVCEKSFKVHSQLQRHFRVHSGERPFKCILCEKAFTQNCHMIQHMRSHTGEKPYKCNVCGKAFSVKTKLRIHLRTHTGEKLYKCTLCRKSYRYHSAFTQHMHSHTAEQSFQ